MIRTAFAEAPIMSRKGAFFDLDRTLVPVNTGRLFVRDLRRRGEISLLKALHGLGFLAQYHLSIVDFNKVTAAVAKFLTGRSEADFAEQCQRLVEDEVLPMLSPGGLREIERHRKNGDMVALLSTSPSYITEPIARSLGLDAVGSTRFEVRGGRFTGQLVGPACFGNGKIHWAENLGRQFDLSIDDSWFYTDSYTDLPMLERVAHRVIVNPDPRLRRTAIQRGWPIVNWQA